MAGARAAHGGLDATPVDLCVASCGTGPCQLPPDGPTRPGGPASHAVARGGGRRGAFGVPVTVYGAAARAKARDEGGGGQAAANAARGAEVLPRPGERPVRLEHP